MESIDALAKAVNEFEGGMVLVSHDMRLISQVANEIWICDHKKIERYEGGIMDFKMDMRSQMGIEKLRGDASEAVSNEERKKTPKSTPAPEPKLEVVKPVVKSIPEEQAPPSAPAAPAAKEKTPSADDATIATVSTASSGDAPKKYIPPHLRKKLT